MIDQFGRNIDYLRISVTDRCNLRCRYCMPLEGVAFTGHDKVMSFEEILLACRCMGRLGLQKVKITGGEPLVRKGVAGLIKMIKDLPYIKEVTLTTNGQLLEENLDSLREAGTDGINISLDTLDKKKYRELTRWGELDRVVRGIEKTADLGFAKIKINALIMKDFNLDDAVKLAAFAKERPIHVRFIEMMPIGRGTKYQPMYQEDIMEQLQGKYGALTKCTERIGNGPAVYYKIPGFLGCIGFISAVSHEFCNGCNRVRLTSDGYLKLCLQYNDGINIKEMIDRNMTEDEITKQLKKAIYEKPVHHDFANKAVGGKAYVNGRETKNMAQIGG